VIAALVLCFGYVVVVWLTFFKYKWLKFTIAWGVVSAFFGAHLLIIFMIGLRFVTPYSSDARIIQRTVQLTPRLPEPTLVSAVLVEPNVHVARGAPLFQFDRRPYEYAVRKAEAELAKAKQDVLVMRSDVNASADKVARLKSELEYDKYQAKLYADLARQSAAREDEAKSWISRVAEGEAAVLEAQADEERARLRLASEIGGVNTTVAAAQAALDAARYDLDNTLMVAPEDGYVINLQVRPGMVAGDYRMGAIATFICDSGRYLLAQYFQENLKYVKPGQPVEAALDLYPGQIWDGTVIAVWRGSGAGQMLPSGSLPTFNYEPSEIPQGQFAVAIKMNDADQSRFPIGTQGRAAIYTNPHSGFAWMRRIGIRTYTWFNWLYPFAG